MDIRKEESGSLVLRGERVKLRHDCGGIGKRIVTLPAPQHGPNGPEGVLKVDADEDGFGGDDAADCLRYPVRTKAREIRVKKLRGV